MIKLNRLVLSFCLLAFAALPGVAQASEPTRIGVYGDWTAYEFVENGNKVCYMAAKEKTAEGNYNSRGDIYALITHRPAENSKNVFSYITGYPYKEGSEASVKIGGQTFSLFTQGETAWAPDADADARIAQAIQKGSTMVVKGTSTRGTLTTDTFSLKGSGAAYDAISKACGI